ncbi:MAG: HAD-IA family hydrolase [Halothiobacillaceae bacterium]
MTDDPKLIIFDWDGTLMDSTDRIVDAFLHAMGDCRLPARDRHEIRDIIGLALPEAVRLLYPEAAANDQQALCRAYSAYYHTIDTPVRPYEGADRLLADLAEAGYWMAVATGKSRRGLDEALEASGLGAHFMTTRCAEESASKPSPLMLEQILDELGRVAARSTMVGDSIYDLQMAANARMASIGITHGVHEAARLMAHGPLCCVDSLGALGWHFRTPAPERPQAPGSGTQSAAIDTGDTAEYPEAANGPGANLAKGSDQGRQGA